MSAPAAQASDLSAAHLAGQLAQTQAQMQQLQEVVKNQSAQMSTLLGLVSSGAGREQAAPGPGEGGWVGSRVDSVWSRAELAQIDARTEVFPLKTEISYKPGGSAKAAEYMKGDVVIAHMNEIFGITGWSMHYKDSIVKVIQQPNTHAKGFFHVFAQTTCVVTLRDGTVRTGLGMNDNEQPAYASAMDTSQKAAETDALKRACKNFGNYLGLACYAQNAKLESHATKAERDSRILAKLSDKQNFRRLMEDACSPAPSLLSTQTLSVSSPRAAAPPTFHDPDTKPDPAHLTGASDSLAGSTRSFGGGAGRTPNHNQNQNQPPAGGGTPGNAYGRAAASAAKRALEPAAAQPHLQQQQQQQQARLAQEPPAKAARPNPPVITKPPFNPYQSRGL